ncbi:MAG: TonB-dependent receptor [Rikenellaceae bacterium]
MNKKLQFFLRALVVILLSLGCGELYAQSNRTIKGVVTLNNGSPIIGATVQLDGTMRGTVTDFNGAFTLSVPAEGRLKVSFLGYEEANVKLSAGQSDYKIILREKTESIDEVVVVGYGTQKRKEVTGAVARVEGEELEKMATADLGTSLQGLVAGLNVQATSGEPGEASQIQIRGVSSITGSNEPLYVVDGVPFDGDPGLAASEIESIDVLKDAASAAVYGTRGAAGVILITTKAGKAGEMKISVDGYYGIQAITSMVPLLSASEYRYTQILGQRIDGTYENTWGASSTISASNSTGIFNNSNLINLVLNNYAAIQNYTLNFSGGSNNLRYSLIANMFDQEGVIINTGLTRYNIRSNATFKRDKWTLISSISVKLEEKYSPSGNMLLTAYSFNPTRTEISLSDVNQAQSGASDTDMDSMSSTLYKFTQENSTTDETIMLNISAAYDISKSLKWTTRFGSSYTNKKTINYAPLFEMYDSDGNLQESTSTRSSMKNTHARTTKMTLEHMLTWNKVYGNHSLTGTAVFSTEKYSSNSFSAQIYDLVASDIVSLDIGTEDMTVDQGSISTNTLVGMLARMQYSYSGKYMLSGSVRRDGSSKFAKDNRWGMFPSVSAGWNISDENFWHSSKMTSLKFRASMGTTGNQSLSAYQYYTVMAYQKDYAFGRDNDAVEASSGVEIDGYANSDVKWETTTQYNLGLDAGWMKNKFTATLDVYRSMKKDMLFKMQIPPSAGDGASQTVIYNVGDMRNQGIELAAGYRGKIKKATINLNITAASNQNEVTKMPENVTRYYFDDSSPIGGSDTSDCVTVVQEGLPAGGFMLMPTNGVINTERKLINYQKYEPNARLGDLMYVDSDGDGDIDDDDREYYGSGAPVFESGFQSRLGYKGFDLTMNWYLSIGNKVINGTEIYTYQASTHRDLLYQWSEANPTSNIPANQGSSHDNYAANSDLWIEDGSFLRLKSLMLGYSLQKKTLQKLGITKCRVYFAADNVFTFTKYTGYDPECGGNGLSTRGLDKGTYPISQKFRVGASLQF